MEDNCVPVFDILGYGLLNNAVSEQVIVFLLYALYAKQLMYQYSAGVTVHTFSFWFSTHSGLVSSLLYP